MPLLWGTAAFLSFDCASTQLAFILYPVWKIIYKITKPIYGTKESEKILHTVFKKSMQYFRLSCRILFDCGILFVSES